MKESHVPSAENGASVSPDAFADFDPAVPPPAAIRERPASKREKKQRQLATQFLDIVFGPSARAGWLVLTIMLLATATASYLEHSDTNREARDHFDQRVTEIRNIVRNRIHAYEQVVRSGAGLFAANPAISREQWKNYVDSIALDHNLPGIQGFGYAPVIGYNTRAPHERKARASGLPDYRIHPVGGRAELTPILYLEPFTDRNRQAFGYDMSSEPVRHNAMLQARDSGTISVSGKVTLVQEITEDVQAGFLIYAPLYRRGAPIETVDQRRAALAGYVFAAFRAVDFMRSLLDTATSDVNIALYADASPSTSALLFDNGVQAEAIIRSPVYTTTTFFEMLGSTWTLSLSSRTAGEARFEHGYSRLIIVWGVLTSILLALLITSFRALSIRRRELADGEHRFRTTFEQAATGLAHVSLEGAWLRVNNQLCEILGYTRNELNKLSFHEVAHPDEIRTDLHYVRSVLESTSKNHSWETRYVQKDNDVVWVLVTMSLVQDRTGTPLYFVCVVEDISALKAAETELRVANDQLESRIGKRTRELAAERRLLKVVLETIDVGIIACDPYGTVFLSNDALRPENQPPGGTTQLRPWFGDYSMFDGDGDTLLSADNAPLLRALRGEHFINEEIDVQPDGGKRYTVMASGQRLRDDKDHVLGAVLVMHDVTERKRAEQALARSAAELAAANATIERDRAQLAERVEQRTAELTTAVHELELATKAAEDANRAKSNFLATMSHEIRTPMNGVIGTLDVLRQSNLRPDQMELTDMINDSALGLLRILDDILDFSKIEASRMDLETELFSLPRCVNRICNTLQSVAVRKGVEISVYTDPLLPAWIDGDEIRIGQILNNLTSNALKFSAGLERPGRVWVRAETVDAEATEPRIRMTISDNGIGISPEASTRLFQPFTQADTSTTRRFGGTGLGLSICRRLAELMNGKIELHSVEGGGTSFVVELPVTVVDNHSLPEMSGSVHLDGLECIIVTQDAQFAADWRSYLEHAGAQCQHAATTGIATPLIAGASGTPLIVVIDSNKRMPDESSPLSAGHPDVRYVYVTRGMRRHPRRHSDHTVSVDRDMMHQHSFIRAVAMAAGCAEIDPVDDKSGDGTGQSLYGNTAPTIEEAAGKGELLLVAEDNEINQKVLRHQLRLLGYAAEIANDGRDAMQRWRSGRHAMLITDLHMPAMDGYELTAAIRKEAGDSRFPIIAFTANTQKEERIRCLEAGMDDYLPKPVQLKNLKTVLEKWMLKEAENPLAPAPHRHPPRTRKLRMQALNTSVLAAQIGNDESLIAEFLDDYRKSSSRGASDLLSAFDSRDWICVGRVAHRLKSSAYSVGALPFADCCAKLERAGESGDEAHIAALVPEFSRLNAEVYASIASHLNEAVTP